MIASDKRDIRNAVTADKISISNDGLVTVKQAYFYRHGRDECQLAAEALQAIKALGFVAEIAWVSDRLARWPRESYFVAAIRVTGRKIEAAS
jgi:hypothetical protein